MLFLNDCLITSVLSLSEYIPYLLQQGCVGSLQYYLLRNHPSYVSRAEDRRQCIAQMQYLRELREQSKRRLLTLTEPQPAVQIPPPPLGKHGRHVQQLCRISLITSDWFDFCGNHRGKLFFLISCKKSLNQSLTPI